LASLSKLTRVLCLSSCFFPILFCHPPGVDPCRSWLPAHLPDHSACRPVPLPPSGLPTYALSCRPVLLPHLWFWSRTALTCRLPAPITINMVTSHSLHLGLTLILDTLPPKPLPHFLYLGNVSKRLPFFFLCIYAVPWLNVCGQEKCNDELLVLRSKEQTRDGLVMLLEMWWFNMRRKYLSQHIMVWVGTMV
jgi:hypothetical protein